MISINVYSGDFYSHIYCIIDMESHIPTLSNGIFTVGRYSPSGEVTMVRRSTRFYANNMV